MVLWDTDARRKAIRRATMRLRSIVRGMVRPMGASNYLIPADVKTTETGEFWDQSLGLTEITRKLKVEAE